MQAVRFLLSLLQRTCSAARQRGLALAAGVLPRWESEARH